jgi:hypothetical protein
MKVKEKLLEIQEYLDSNLSDEQIAKIIDCPPDWVLKERLSHLQVLEDREHPFFFQD